MKKYSFQMICIIFSCLLFLRGENAQCAEQTADDLVRDFYAWYVEKKNSMSPRGFPEHDDAIYSYVYACTVNRLRVDIKKGAMDSNYFLKSNDFDYEYVKKILRVHTPVKIDNSLTLVPVGGAKSSFLVAFVQKTKEGWRIIKVENGYLYGYADY